MKKDAKKDIILQWWVPIISLLVACISLIYTKRVDDRVKYDQTPSFNIIQNLWNPDNPSFTLINESTKKLAQIPYHTYFTMIPTKILFSTKKDTYSILVLLPISYQNIQKQVNTFKTTGELETSYLPSNFFGKLGTRDTVIGKSMKLTNNLSAQVITYPMLVIYCEGKYRFSGDKDFKEIRFLSTPLDKIDVNKSFSKNLKDYIKDNANMEIRLKKNESVYLTANQLVEKKLKNLKTHKAAKNSDAYFIGGKKGGYGFILKKINNMISPVDPLSN